MYRYTTMSDTRLDGSSCRSVNKRQLLPPLECFGFAIKTAFDPLGDSLNFTHLSWSSGKENDSGSTLSQVPSVSVDARFRSVEKVSLRERKYVFGYLFTILPDVKLANISFGSTFLLTHLKQQSVFERVVDQFLV